MPKAPLLITSRLNQLRHHVLLSHGLAVQAIRARSRTGTQIGPAENISVCVPVVETPEHIAAAELAIREVDASYLTAMMEGRYRESFLAAAGVDAPKVAAGDMSVISTPVDFVAPNVYLPGTWTLRHLGRRQPLCCWRRPHGRLSRKSSPKGSRREETAHLAPYSNVISSDHKCRVLSLTGQVVCRTYNLLTAALGIIF